MTSGKEIRTARLILRPLTRAHLEPMLSLISAKEIAATTLRIPHPYTREHAEEYFQSMQSLIDEGTMLRLSIFIAASEEYCGSVGLHIECDNDRAELGYWVGVPYWRRGIASEAAKAVVEHGIGDLGLNRIYATVFAGNMASRRVAEKAGMKYEGCLRQHIKKWGEMLDMEVYGIVAADLPRNQG